MMSFFNLNEVKLLHIIFAVAILVCGYWIAKLSSNHLERVSRKKLSKQNAMILRRLIFYSAMLLFLITALQQLGFKLGVVLGAAGVFTVAIGFAAQTSVANLISGLFLLVEHPFRVDDTIVVKGLTGVVESIDFLSTRLRTSDNTLVRIPNENIMQVEIINLSYFKQRCVTLIIGIEYGESFDKIKSTLLQLAKDNTLALPDPKPTVIISNFGGSAINIEFSVWGLTSHYKELKNSLQEQIKIAFEKEKINMPFPQLTIHSTNSIQN